MVNLTVTDNGGLTNMTSQLVTIWIAGDANGDGKVDTADYAIWLDNYYKNLMGYSFGDFNSDGSVDGTDYAIWSNNYGK